MANRLDAGVALVTAAGAVTLVLFLTGCSRAGARVPLTSLPFPDTPTGFRAQASLPLGVTVLPVVDAREVHYDERVGGTHWTGCRTDPFVFSNAATVVQSRLVTALEQSQLFSVVSVDAVHPEAFVFETEMDAFCAQVVGFIYDRVAGISSFRFRVRNGDREIFNQKIEQVVTDADDAYTGWAAATVEQGMERAMADSLRLVLTQLLNQAEPVLARAVPVPPTEPAAAAGSY